MSSVASPAALAAEARVLGRYLVCVEPPPVLVDRWVDAVRTLGLAAADPADAAVVDFAVRHPWSVGPLDTACGLLRRGGLLRQKLLVLAAVLEASPEFADEFLPRSVSLPRLLARFAGVGLTAAVEAVVGLVVLPLAARARA